VTEEKAIELLESIQRAFENKDPRAALEYYHDNISLINPAFAAPIEGKADLEDAFRRHFAGPQATRMSFKNVRLRELGGGDFVLHCQVEGIQTLYLSGKQFKGYLSRVFVNVDGRPLIVHEHFSFKA
jgi:ketosteroid isomerase-like protein